MKIKVKIAKPQTMEEKFFEVFPTAPKDDEGYPKTCPYMLGFEKYALCDKFNDNCKKCWDRQYKE